MRNITEWSIPAMAGLITFLGYMKDYQNLTVATIAGISWGITFLMPIKIYKIIKNR